MADIESKFVEVDGINTHYLEAGPKDAPTVGLLHSGEFGGCSEISWNSTFQRSLNISTCWRPTG